MPRGKKEKLYFSRLRIKPDLQANLKLYGSITYFEDKISTVVKAFPNSPSSMKDLLKDMSDTESDEKKSADKSIQLRKSGNDLYIKCNTMRDYIEVLRVYNESIAYAPNNSEELALAFGNRATVLFRLNYFRESLADINRALCLPYPDKSMGKLLIKKVHCMKIIDHPDVSIIYDDCLKWIDQHSTNPDEKKKELKCAIEDQAPLCKTIINTQFCDELLKQFQKLCPNLDKVQIGKNSKGELALIAAKDIQVGEAIAVEKIYIQGLHIEKPYLACWNCVMLCLNPIPCDGCSAATYCSESCKAEAWSKHHENECKIMYLMQSVMSEFFFPVMVCIYAAKQLGGILPLMKEVYKMNKIEDMKKEHSVVDGTYPSESYRSVYYMVNNFSIPSDASSNVNVLKVIAFVYFLATRSTFFNKQYEGDLYTVMEEKLPKFFASLIMRHFVLMHQVQMETIILPYQMLIGRSAVTPLFHIINHSCNPNSVKITLKDHQILVAIDTIKKGQEINITYLYSPAIQETSAKRKEMALQRFKDSCKCEMCAENPLKLLSLQTLEKSPQKIQEMMIIRSEIVSVLRKQFSNKPKSAEEFLQRITDLCEYLRPFFKIAPPLCKEVISYKNHLMALFLNVHRAVYGFLADSV